MVFHSELHEIYVLCHFIKHEKLWTNPSLHQTDEKLRQRITDYVMLGDSYLMSPPSVSTCCRTYYSIL
jgi:hypothetical protein